MQASPDRLDNSLRVKESLEVQLTALSAYDDIGVNESAFALKQGGETWVTFGQYAEAPL
jgi:hypothetical protein